MFMVDLVTSELGELLPRRLLCVTQFRPRCCHRGQWEDSLQGCDAAELQPSRLLGEESLLSGLLRFMGFPSNLLTNFESDGTNVSTVLWAPGRAFWSLPPP